MKRFITRLTALVLALSLCLLSAAFAEGAETNDRVCFLLMCNEGMSNDGDNVQNTMMVVSFDPQTGKIRLLMLTWDTFINLEGYDIPQLLDQPYRVNGPEGTLKAVNDNFNQNIERFLSINYLNLANLIDTYGGVEVDITRAERNALNGMVSSKKNSIQRMAEMGIIEQILVEALVREYYLDNWGAETHLNGLQAVGFGWLQYDSVYNCCMREVAVISDLFDSVGGTINNQIVFYTSDTTKPESMDGRRLINLDDPTDEDKEFLYTMVSPIFDKSYNNLDEEEIIQISLTLSRAAYLASRQGINIFENVEVCVLPLEVNDPYDKIAGTEGHIVDYEANAAAMRDFLYGAD